MKKMEISIATKQLLVGWQSSKGGEIKPPLVKYCAEPDKMRKILTEGLWRACSKYSKDVVTQDASDMMAQTLNDYQYDDVQCFVAAIKSIAVGEVEIYGKVTPNDWRRAFESQIEKKALDLENDHYSNKGYGVREVRDNESALSTAFMKFIGKLGNMKNLINRKAQKL